MSLTSREHPLEDPQQWGGCTVEELLSRIKGGAGRLVTSGLQGSSLSYLVARILSIVPDKPILVVAADHQRAYQLFEEVRFYSGETERTERSRIYDYPADEVLPYSEMLRDRGTVQRRLRGLLQLQQELSPVLVMPASALIRRVPPQTALSQRSDLLLKDEEIDREEILDRLVQGGYQRVSVVEDRGTFASRGGVLDVFSPLYPHPARLELDDIYVESIKFFDPMTQRTLGETQEFLLGPVDEVLYDSTTLRHARGKLADLADNIEYPTLELRKLIDDLSNGLRPFNMQALMPAFYDRLESIFDYLPPQTLIVLDEPRDIRVEIMKYHTRMQEGFEHLVETNKLGFPPDTFLLGLDELRAQLRLYNRLEHDEFSMAPEFTKGEATLQGPAPTPTQDDATDSGTEAETETDASPKPPPITSTASEFGLPALPASKPLATKAQWGDQGELILPFATRSHYALKQHLRNQPLNQEHRLQPLIDKIKQWRNDRMRVLVVCGSKGQALRLKELLELYSMRVHIWDQLFEPSLLDKKSPEAHVEVMIGRITNGFMFPKAKLSVLSEEEIFGPKARRRRAKKKGVLHQTELEQLRPGDFVIHRQHGVAKYGGLHTITLDDVTSDFVLLEYKGKDRLYLPVTRLSQIERYGSGGKPSIDRLKGHTFERKKNKAKAAIQAMAGDLLQLYAQRQARKGYIYPKPDEAYRQFEADFPFTETEDQRKAIEDVLEDMQTPRVLDRLICGDVGYGKTEVAIRAAFMAAMSGKQVAVLVPTTVLAQQHGLSFKERLDGYPVKVAVMSRFQSKKEQKEVVDGLQAGKVDIVIGTHRLLSRDVHFKDLGLLIIDEEQRFGVRHKEKFKQYRQMVDVLTLTATPIPRTLEMAVMGTRDLSLITTPPHDRLAIRTTIAPFSEEVIREAVMRELNRGGQVFFVHNRIESIGRIQETLAKIVPEARTVVAHGQMPEGELERVMLDFMQGRYNLLLCTSIIESGLDIPRANTILVDRADHFGLAQLYQIRGRVGRGKERAYAVLLVPSDKRINAEAKQRLATLQRFTELGAGFEIARHDLEMRGAGNILGKQQSGHIHAIGFDLYIEMLQEAIDELQGKPKQEHIEPEVQLGIDAFISDSYIPDVQLRLQCYRRLSAAETPEELDQLSLEFSDRFGYPPPEVDALFQMIEIKQMLRALRAVSGKVGNDKFRMFFHPQAPLDVDAMLQLSMQKDPPFRLLPNSGIETTGALSSGQQGLAEIRHFLRALPSQILLRSTTPAKTETSTPPSEVSPQ